MNDFTSMSVWDPIELCEVDSLRFNQMSWSDQRARILVMARRWNNCDVWAEWNSIGDPNIEELRKAGANVYDFKTTAQSKPPMIQALYLALHEQGAQLLDDPVVRHEFRSFISKQTVNGHWQYEAQQGAHDDTVIARGLGIYGCNNLMAHMVTFDTAPDILEWRG